MENPTQAANPTISTGPSAAECTRTKRAGLKGNQNTLLGRRTYTRRKTPPQSAKTSQPARNLERGEPGILKSTSGQPLGLQNRTSRQCERFSSGIFFHLRDPDVRQFCRQLVYLSDQCSCLEHRSLHARSRATKRQRPDG